jgi:hypothetical protein
MLDETDKQHRDKMYRFFQNKGVILSDQDRNEIRKIMKEHADARATTKVPIRKIDPRFQTRVWREGDDK